MSRVESASGARYSAHNETARKFEPIAPVGTNYTPIGKVDIAAIRSAAGPAPPQPPVPSAPRPSAVIPAAQGPIVRTTTVGSAAAAARVPTGTWDAPKQAVTATPPPPPAPPTVVATSRSVPAHSATVPTSNVPTKPSEDDRIGSVVSLADSSFIFSAQFFHLA
jgi:drebrin-like protein